MYYKLKKHVPIVCQNGPEIIWKDSISNEFDMIWVDKKGNVNPWLIPERNVSNVVFSDVTNNALIQVPGYIVFYRKGASEPTSYIDCFSFEIHSFVELPSGRFAVAGTFMDQGHARRNEIHIFKASPTAYEMIPVGVVDEIQDWDSLEDPNKLVEFLYTAKIKTIQETGDNASNPSASVIETVNDGESNKTPVKQEIVQPEEVFKKAISIAENMTCGNLNHQAQFEKKRERFVEAIKTLKKQTADDVRLKKLTAENASLIEAATLELTQSGNTKAFSEKLNKIERCKSSVWQKILAAVVGAAIGFFAGLMIGAVTASPAAALTALAGGVAGAIVGASVGTVAGVLTSVGLFNGLNKSPAAKLVDAANEIKQMHKLHLVV